MRKSRWAVAALAVALGAAACGGDGDSTSGATAPKEDVKVNAVVASYELESATPQRVLVGLVTDEQEQIGFGTVDLTFRRAGGAVTRAQGTYRLLPGQRAGANADRPRIVRSGSGNGLYGAEGVVFDEPGTWEVTAEVDLDGRTLKATTRLAVLPDSTVLEVGDRAPATVNHLPGAPGVPPGAIDSRAKDAQVPDPILHQRTIADALGQRRPLLVVVSTPVYCVSRFCGPITDVVERLADTHGDQMNFIHLEVWRDYEEPAVNKAAAEWIFPAAGAERAAEPWVFLVGSDGVITHRFDNVASEAELSAAIADVLA